MCKCLLFIPLLVAPLYVSAQQTEEQPLDEIVITATRLQTTARDVNRSVSVVDQQRIQNGTQQLALDEALAGTPGLYMQNRYNMAQDLRISLRGFGARSAFGIRGIKVIVDGIPQTLPDGQAGVDSIDLGSASRIQVLRGPSSALYGNASGGVIIIESEMGQEPSFLEAGLATGGLGYQKYQLKTGGLVNRFDYLVNASTQELDGYRDHSASEGSLVNARFGFQINEYDSLKLIVNSTDQPLAQDPGGITSAQVMRDRQSARDRNLLYDAGEALDQQRVGIVYTTDRTSGSLLLRNYYVWRDFSNKLPFQSGGAVDLQRFFYGVGAQYTFADAVPEQLQLMLGFDLDRQDDERKRFDNLQGVIGPLTLDQRERVDSDGLFVQGKYRFNDRWDGSAGLRYDEISYDVNDHYLVDGDDSGKINFDQFSYSVGLSRDFGNGMLFGTINSSFETPTTTELANPDGSGGFNQSLQPQTAINYEVGFKSGAENLYYELAVFHINLEDELVPYELPGSPGRTFYVNAGESSRTGIESAVSWSSPGGFGIDASLTWSDFRFDDFIDDNGNDFSGSQMPGVPEFFGYVGLNYTSTGGFKAMLETSYSGSLYANNANSVKVSSYLVTGLRASYTIETGNLYLRPYAGINNLFNTHYDSNIRINAFGGRYYEPAPERNIYVGIKIRHKWNRG
ncbi:MAG: TonB-dependent receptor [Xanthomonadales bacterium]|nr:TonB-dependent receptor [Xanthomonadales bacterium]